MSVTMAEWAKLLPWSHVARMFGCAWSTVEQAVKAVVAYGRERQELDGLTHIGVDEIARKRGHVYLTVVYDLKKSRLVWVGDGRTRETLERFFDFLGEDFAKRLEAVCCDMWRPYVNAVRARAPQALIVFDKFHIVSHLGKAVDEVRREEIREKGQAHKDLVKNSRYLWLKNPWNLTGGQAERLATLVKHAQSLRTPNRRELCNQSLPLPGQPPDARNLAPIRVKSQFNLDGGVPFCLRVRW